MLGFEKNQVTNLLESIDLKKKGRKNIGKENSKKMKKIIMKYKGKYDDAKDEDIFERVVEEVGRDRRVSQDVNQRLKILDQFLVDIETRLDKI